MKAVIRIVEDILEECNINSNGEYLTPEYILKNEAKIEVLKEVLESLKKADTSIDTSELYCGMKVRITKAGSRWDWWSSEVGKVYTVIEIRERYDDVIVEGGNCIDFDCIKPYKEL